MTDSARLSAATGLVLGAFTFAHMGSNFSLHWGLKTHQAWNDYFRPVYQNPVVETILFASWAVHVALAVAKKRGGDRKQQKTFFTWNDPAKLVHEASGWFLVMSIPGHVFATRLMTWVSGLDRPDVTYIHVAGSLAPGIFTFYNFTLGAAGLVHMFSGIGRALRSLAPKNKAIHSPVRGALFWVMASVLTLAALSTALAVDGFYFPIEVSPERYRAILGSLRKYWPAFLLPPVSN